jgi:hypothetical protein
MWRIVIPVVALAAIVMALPASADDKADGWVELFNGKDLTGWKIHPKPSGGIAEVITKEADGKVVGYDGKTVDVKSKDGKVTPGKMVHLWRVEDGVLIGAGPPSHLFSARGDYVNFKYKVVAQINNKGNSGQYFRTAYGPGFPQGYEAQINATHGDPVRTGSIYPAGSLGKFRKEICVLNDAPHKPDEWFTQEVTAIGDKITIAVNGKVTIEWKDPGHTFKKGHFALQGHDPGTVVKFKSIAVKELK